MIVYHGSIAKIEHPLVDIGRKNLDFGQGFYVTDILDQATLWASRLAERKGTPAIVNVYELNIERVQQQFRYFCFGAYDEQWLQFILDCRQGGEGWRQYDVIEGGVANDRVIDTIEAYMAGLMPLSYALTELAKHQPNNQLCITNQMVVDTCLTFVEDKLC